MPMTKREKQAFEDLRKQAAFCRHHYDVRPLTPDEIKKLPMVSVNARVKWKQRRAYSAYHANEYSGRVTAGWIDEFFRLTIMKTQTFKVAMWRHRKLAARGLPPVWTPLNICA